MLKRLRKVLNKLKKLKKLEREVGFHRVRIQNIDTSDPENPFGDIYILNLDRKGLNCGGVKRTNKFIVLNVPLSDIEKTSNYIYSKINEYYPHPIPKEILASWFGPLLYKI